MFTISLGVPSEIFNFWWLWKFEATGTTNCSRGQREAAFKTPKKFQNFGGNPKLRVS